MHLTRSGLLGVLVLMCIFPATGFAQEAILAEGDRRVNEGAAAQKTIDKLDDQKRTIESDYANALKVVDGLKVYNALLQKQVDNQRSEMNSLRDSMDKVSLIERQILPLMIRMIGSLEEFIALDVPFLQEERTHRIASLRGMMERSDVTAAEKFRRVLEAYQIEVDYGNTIEAYRGDIDVGGSTQQVDFLRFGRVQLLYQSIGGDNSGVWGQASRQWQPLSSEQYKSNIARGLAVARKQAAPDLLVLPIPAAQGVVQ